MRVLVLSQHYWPETFRITEVVASLRARGIEVAVLTGQPNYPEGRVFPGYRAMSAGVSTHEGTPIHRVPVIPRGSAGALRLIANYLSFIVSASVCGPWLLRGAKFDVVFVYATSPMLQAIPAIWIGWLKRARVVSWVQDLWPESLQATGFVRHPLLLRAVAAVVAWIYRHNDLLLVQSDAFIEPVQRLAGKTPVVPHPNPGERQGEPGADDGPALRLPDAFNIVFTGNLGKVQALETILDAAERLRDRTDIRWTLVGSGSRSDWLRDEIRRRGLTSVEAPGRFAPAAIPGILAQASVLLVSLARSPILSLTVPSKVQNYLAAGRPIVASLDGEGARVVAEAEAGIGCAAEDAEALAAAVVALHALPAAERERLGANGKRYFAQHFTAEGLAARLEALLGSATDRR